MGRAKWPFLGGRRDAGWIEHIRPDLMGTVGAPELILYQDSGALTAPFSGQELRKGKFVRLQSEVFINWRHCCVLLGQISQWPVFPSFLEGKLAKLLFYFFLKGEWCYSTALKAAAPWLQICWLHLWGLLPQHFRVSISISKYFELGKSRVSSGYVAWLKLTCSWLLPALLYPFVLSNKMRGFSTLHSHL